VRGDGMQCVDRAQSNRGAAGVLIIRFTRSGEATEQRLDAAYVNHIVKEQFRAAGTEDAGMYSTESLRVCRRR